MEYTIELMKILVNLFEELECIVDHYNTTLDTVFSDVITLGSEIVEWEVSSIENVIKEK